MTQLVTCLLALVIGPVLYSLSRSKATTYSFFDGFVLVAVAALVLLEILPRTLGALGMPALAVGFVGFVLPHLVEHRLGSLPVSPRTILSGVIIVGLILHQLLDGAALEVGHDETHALSSLAMAVILHQIPKGFLLWELAGKARGTGTAVLVIGGLLGATVAGFLLGSPALGVLGSEGVLYFQAFVAGGLLHVVVHHVPRRSPAAGSGSPELWGGLGALAALAGLALLPGVHGHEEDARRFLEPVSQGTVDFRATFLGLALESAFPILLGLVAAGLIQVFVPAGPLLWFRGGSRVSESVRGILLGIPLPVCSCGVTPIYHTLVRRGVPPAAAVAFLIATPEIGVDSFFLSFGLLGAQIALLRLGMAFLVALVASVALSRLYATVRPAPDLPVEDIEGELALDGSRRARLAASFRYGFVELLDEIGVWLVAGLALAAIAEPYLRPEWFASLPSGAEVAILALVGLPMYVCASGATPLAAVLLSKGVSAGAVLAFLITGPSTNVTTLGVLARLHGARRAAALPIAVLALSVGLGFAINAIPGLAPPRTIETIASEEHGPIQWFSGAVLLVLLALSVLRLGPRGFLARILGDRGSAGTGCGPCGETGGHAGHGH